MLTVNQSADKRLRVNDTGESYWRSHLQSTYQTYVSIAAGALIALAPSLFPFTFEADFWLIVRQVLFVVLLLVSASLLFFVPKGMRSDLSKLQDQIDASEAEQKKQALELVNTLSMPINFFAEVASEGKTAGDRRQAMIKVRSHLLTEVQNRLSSKNYRVRVNLFVANPDKETLKVPPGCSTGGPQSVRIFEPGDETYAEAVAGKGRVVLDCTNLKDFADIADSRGNPRYKCFSAFPVAVPGRLFGILAVDANVEEAFTEYDDELMGYYTHLLAAMFLYEAWPYWIPTNGSVG